MTDLNQPKETTTVSFQIPDVQKTLRNDITEQLGELISWSPDLAWKEYGLCIKVSENNLLKVMTELKENPKFRFEMLMDLTCVDWLDSKENRFEVVYQLMSVEFLTRLCVKVEVQESRPEVDSVLPLWASANFMEREVFDMFGVIFKGHGDLRRILMYDEFVGHPLRKDYPLKGKQSRIELRVPELRNTSADLHRQELVAMPKKRVVS